MATMTGDVPCAGCGVMNRVTLVKERIGDSPPKPEYVIRGEASLVGGGLFTGSVPDPDADTEDTESEGE